MGSIPLPALHLNPPPDPSEGFQRAIQLRELMQRQQLFPGQLQAQQQQLQSSQLENQLRAQQVKDSQTLQTLAPNYLKKDSDGKPTGFDYDGFAADAQSKGVSPATMAQLTTVRKNASDAALAQANTGKATLDAQEKLNDQAFSHLEGIRGETDPAKRQANWQSALQWAAQNGVQGAQQLPPQAPDDKALGTVEMSLGLHRQALEDAKTQASAQEASAKAAESGAQTKKLQAELDFYQKKGIAPGVPLDVQEAQDWLSKNPGKGPADFMAYKAKLVPQFNFNLQNAGAAGGGGKPSAIAQAIADGSMKWQDAVSPRTPMAVKSALLTEVKGINPNFNSGDFTVEQKVKEAFTSGAYSQQLNSINRAREHMGTFLELAKDLDGGSVQAFNRIGNAFSVEFGSDKVGNLNIAKQAFASEVGKAFAGASVGVTDRQELDRQISAASSFTQLAGAARTADKLLQGAQKALQQTYQSGVKAQPNFGGGTTPTGGAITVQAPNGKTYTFKDQASADAFKQKAGIQ